MDVKRKRTEPGIEDVEVMRKGRHFGKEDMRVMRKRSGSGLTHGWDQEQASVWHRRP